MANQKREPMSVDLLRQRRNLLITSLMLVAINIAGATIKKDYSFVGVSLEFSHPERIVWCIWILWLYFLIRYWQYFNEENDLGIHKGMAEWIEKKIPPFEKSDYEVDRWIDWKYLVFWSLHSIPNGLDPDYPNISEHDPKNKIIKSLWTFQSFISVATKTPRFTDYLMPFLVASIPLSIKVLDVLYEN